MGFILVIGVLANYIEYLSHKLDITFYDVVSMCSVEIIRRLHQKFNFINLTKSEMKALHGLLNKRNECAHPSEYFPDLNETLGYISELLNRIRKIRERNIKT